MVSAFPQLPQTSSAVNIQIIEPKNFPGGAVPGQINNVGAPGVGSPTMYGSPQSQMGAGGYPSNYNNLFPSMNPQQALQNAYTQALNARSQAEQARNGYLNLANQLNTTAYQQQQYYQPNPFTQQQPYGYPPQPMPYGYPPQPGQFGPPPGQFGPQGMMPEQMAPPPPQPQPEPMAPPPGPPEPQVPTLKTANVEDLNMMVDQPATLQERVDAMEEIGVRGFGTPKTYELLQREALADTSHLEGQARDDANYVRQAALWTLGMLNKAQNGTVPTDSLPGLNAIEQILKARSENPDVKAAAVQALQVINRPQDKRIKKVLKRASKDKNPDVKRLAKDALSGKTIPIPAAALQ